MLKSAASSRFALNCGLSLLAMLPMTVHSADKPVPNAQKPAPFTFVVFGDNRPAQATGPVPEVFKQIVAEVHDLHPDFVVTTGDLINGSATDLALVNKQYDEVLPIVNSVGVPIYFAAGNHEIRSVKANEDLYRQRVYNKLYYSFDYGNSHFIVLDSDIVGQEHKITGEQIVAFERDLQAVQGKAKHIFVFLHQQPYPVSLHIGSSLDTFPAERDRFQSLLEKYHVEYLITGHEHLYDDSVRNGVHEIISGGAGAPLYPSKRGGSFFHYLVITVDGDQTYVNVVKPGALFSYDKVLEMAPGEKKEPGVPLPAH
ncbi:MAG: metallophosphoesterase [Abitibacteriaceae bacterium]|nr:metallophosphoesterase [Abditibacteriaceae bacterium]MBV9867295.1 metallophosphoesterase [Abditibacteriaceae bacterium]